jgi:uncharacterized protein
MTVRPTYPGVYIEEAPSEVRTIGGVSTSTAAFVGYFRRGPVDTPVRIFNLGDFQREFGGLLKSSEASYAIQQFFLNGGAEAWVVRVADFTSVTGGALGATAAVLIGDESGVPRVRVVAGRSIRGKPVMNPGPWGNELRVEVDYNTASPADLQDEDPDLTAGELFNLTVTQEVTKGGRPVVLASETFRNLTLRDGSARNALQVVNSSSRLVQLDRNFIGTALNPASSGLAALSTPPERPAAVGTIGAPIAVSGFTAPSHDDSFTISDGINTVTCIIDYGAPAASPSTPQELRPYLEKAIRSAGAIARNPLFSGATVEIWPTHDATPHNRFCIKAGRGGSAFNPATTLTLQSSSPSLLANLGFTIAPNVQQYSPMIVSPAGAQTGNNKGSDGSLPGAAELQGTRGAKTGLFALEDTDLFNILCIPRAANLNGTEMRAVYSTATAYCQERRAFLIVDIPESVDSIDEMVTWMTDNASLRSSNSAVYFPRVRIPDPEDGFRLKSVAASGTVAGLYARTDTNRGVWKAPGGTEANLINVPELNHSMSDPENGVLNPLGVNALRNFPVSGNVVWGARTLDGADALASQWKYVPVRRLALFIEESLYRGTQWVVFEPNDEPLWAQIRLNVGAFMHNLFRRGAFQGSSPKQAYLVKCDSETTTQNEIDQGIVNILVGFAPLKPAEFVIIKIQQLTGQVQA